MPRLQIWSLVGHIQEATDRCLSRWRFSPSLSVPLPLSLSKKSGCTTFVVEVNLLTSSVGHYLTQPRRNSFFLIPHPRICPGIFIEWGKQGGEEKEGETSSWVRNAAFCMHPKHGSNLQPRHVPWPGIEPPTFCYIGWGSNQMSQTSQSWTSIFRFWRHLRKVLQYAWEKVLF